MADLNLLWKILQNIRKVKIWFIMYLVFLQMKSIKQEKMNFGIMEPNVLMLYPEI